jgi:membrane-bound lytic murein transglycosylase B
MRVSSLSTCVALAATLYACGSNPPKTATTDTQASAGETPVAAAAEPATPARPAVEVVPQPVGAYAAGSLTGDYAGYPAARAAIERLAQEEGFDRAYLDGLFSRLERQQWILDYLNRPKRPSTDQPTGSWTRYRKKFVTEQHIERGLRFWREHAATLQRAERRYGIPPEYVVAIIGVETHYGANVGRHRVVNALATLAFDYPRRSDFFTRELEHYLVMARNEGFDPFEPRGSYAGAMGLGQFMPSSFHRFAVDFDGDGRRDLWHAADAIGSVAHYFSAHGWRTGEPVAIPAVARGGDPRFMKAGYDTRYRVDTLAQQGLVARFPLDAEGEVSLLRLDAVGGYEYWLGLPNFYVITRYNHSSYYAMAVYQLAQALRERRDRLDGVRISLR